MKGFERLISILSPLFKIRNRLKLLIVGEGPLFEMLLQLIQKEDLSQRILLLGGRRDIPELLFCSDIFVSMSQIESFSIVVLEAMTARKAVIAPYNAAGVRDLIINNETGYLISENDFTKEFLNAIDHLLDNPGLREQMGEAGFKRAMMLYEKSVVMPQITSLYNTLHHS